MHYKLIKACSVPHFKLPVNIPIAGLSARISFPIVFIFE
jgi:hypothetical protein